MMSVHSPILISAMKTCIIKESINRNVPRHFLTSRQSKKNQRTIIGAYDNSGRDQRQKIFRHDNKR